MFLQQRLEEAGKVQSEMMEVRLGREVEKSKSVLYKSRLGAGGIPYTQDPADGARNVARNGVDTSHTNNEDNTQHLSQEQAQLFAEENSTLLNHYNTQLDQLNSAEKSILEISELQGTLTANLQLQQESIDQLVQDSYLTTENLGKGNKELKRASERRSMAQAVFWSTCAFCGGLVLWDLIF